MTIYNGREVTVLGPTHPDQIELVKIQHNDSKIIEDVAKHRVEYTDEEFEAEEKSRREAWESLKKARYEAKQLEEKDTPVEVKTGKAKK